MKSYLSRWLMLSLLIAQFAMPSSSSAGSLGGLLSPLKNLFGIKDQPKQCDETPKELPPADDVTLLSRGDYYFAEGNYCEAARSYMELLRQNPASPSYRKAWLLLIKAYQQAGEDILALNEALRMAQEHRGSASGEQAHIMALIIVHNKAIGEVYENPKRWNEFALGLNPEQTKANPYFQNMIYMKFTEIYPNSTANELIKGFYVSARNMYARSVLDQGHQLEMRKQYLKAFDKYSLLLKWGIALDVFGETLYKMIRLQLTLSVAVLKSSEFTNEQILSLSDLKSTADASVLSNLRMSISRETINEAKALYLQMKKNIPNDPWTKKATQEFGLQLK